MRNNCTFLFDGKRVRGYLHNVTLNSSAAIDGRRGIYMIPTHAVKLDNGINEVMIVAPNFQRMIAVNQFEWWDGKIQEGE